MNWLIRIGLLLLSCASLTTAITVAETDIIYNGKALHGYVPLVTPSTKGIAFLYDVTFDPWGWTMGHEDGRHAMVAEFGNRVSSAYLFIHDGDGSTLYAVQELLKRGYRLFIGESNAFHSTFMQFCTPNITSDTAYFITNSDPRTCANVGGFRLDAYQAAFLIGVATGATMSPTAKICHYGLMSAPTFVMNANAFGLGVELGTLWNPVKFTAFPTIHTWTLNGYGSAATPNYIIRQLIDVEKCTIYYQGTYGAVVDLYYAAGKGATVIASGFDASKVLGEQVFSSISPNLTPVFLKYARAFMNGAGPRGDFIVMKLEQNAIYPTHTMTQDRILSPKVDPTILDLVAQIRDQILDPTQNVNPWCLRETWPQLNESRCWTLSQMESSTELFAPMKFEKLLDVPKPQITQEGQPSSRIGSTSIAIFVIGMIEYTTFALVIGLQLDHPYVKAISGRIVLVGLFGLAVAHGGSLLTTLVFPSQKVCEARWWVLTLASCLFTVHFWSKLTRIGKIFDDKGPLKKKKIPDWLVLGWLFCYILIPVIYLGTLTAINEVSQLEVNNIEIYNGEQIENEIEQWVVEIKQIFTCSQNTYQVTGILGFLGFLWILNIWKVIETYEVPSEFNESRQIVFCAVFIVFISIFIVPVELAFDFSIESIATIRVMYMGLLPMLLAFVLAWPCTMKLIVAHLKGISKAQIIDMMRSNGRSATSTIGRSSIVSKPPTLEKNGTQVLIHLDDTKTIVPEAGKENGTPLLNRVRTPPVRLATQYSSRVTLLKGIKTGSPSGDMTANSI